MWGYECVGVCLVELCMSGVLFWGVMCVVLSCGVMCELVFRLVDLCVNEYFVLWSHIL